MCHMRRLFYYINLQILLLNSDVKSKMNQKAPLFDVHHRIPNRGIRHRDSGRPPRSLKDLLGGTIKIMMETEMDEQHGYESYERSDNDNYRNETKRKKVRNSYGEFEIGVPQDRNSSCEPQVVQSVRRISQRLTGN